MFNLLDLMRAAQGGAAMENMARQFGLSVDQTRRAMEALMPAFALGFQRSAADPTGFANLLRMMGSGQYASFFDQPNPALSPQAWSEGNRIIGQLFGPEVSRQVAEQTAAWAGVAPEIMRQMMPAVAATLMGGLFRSAANEGLADLFDQFARILRGDPSGGRSTGRGDEPAAMPDPFGAWAAMLRLWGVPPPAAETPKPEAPADQFPNPFAPWAAMMNGMLGAAAPETPPTTPAPEPESKTSPPPEPPVKEALEFFGRMFETGREAQQQHLATLQSIFDAYWGPAPKRP